MRSPARTGGGAAEAPGAFPFAAGRGRCRLWGTAIATGDGVAVTLLGGERPHLGAVAVAVPRPSLVRRGRRSATTSVLAMTGHKDDEIARPLADTLARRLGQVAVVVAGVHVERPRAVDFTRIFRNTERVLEILLSEVRARTGDHGHPGPGGETRRRRRR